MQSRYPKPQSQVGSPQIASCHNSSASDINSYQSFQVWNYSKSDTEFCILFGRLYHSPSASAIWFEACGILAVCGQIQHYPWSLTSLSDTFWGEWNASCISKLNTAHLWHSFSEWPGNDTLTQPKIEMSHGLFLQQEGTNEEEEKKLKSRGRIQLPARVGYTEINKHVWPQLRESTHLLLSLLSCCL